MKRSHIKINGIRLGSRLNQVFQIGVIGDTAPAPLYQTLAECRTNIACLGFQADGVGTFEFCCHDLPSDKNAPGKFAGKGQTRVPGSKVCTVSVYPHNASLNTLGFLIGLFGKKGIAFQQMVSSNAMISFIIDRSDQERVLALFEQKFDLPPTQTPFQQNFNNETIAFVKKRYAETRASYVEERVKTYGIQLAGGLEMSQISFNPNHPDHFDTCGKGLQQLDAPGGKFYFTAAMTLEKDACHLFFLTDPLAPGVRQSFISQVQAGKEIHVCPSLPVDLISFHGPHFGDRFGIFNTAMTCLKTASIKVLLAGCTGASICMVLPAAMGKLAILALEKGFETP